MTVSIEQVKGIKSKEARDEVMYAVLENNEFDAFISLLFTNDMRLREKCCWVLQKITDAYPDVIHPYCKQMVDFLPHYKSDAEKRFLMRYFMTQPLPKDDKTLATLLNFGFDWILNPKEAIATRANAMTVLYRITLVIPELTNELISVIETTLEFGSSGYKNRAKHILKKLKKNS